MSAGGTYSEANDQRSGHDQRSYRIRKVAPTKRPGAVLANVTVEVGDFWIRFRVVRTAMGLAVFGPANAFSGNGRTRFRACAGVRDPLLWNQVQADVLAAFEAHQRAAGRPVPGGANRGGESASPVRAARPPEIARMRADLEEFRRAVRSQ